MVVGPTAVGKTKLAVQLAKYFGCEILSADARQFYKEMSVGTAKPTLNEMDGIPHHFIDHLSIHDAYSAGMYEKEAMTQLTSLFKKQNYAVLVGGSGLFIDAVCHGLDDIPKATNQIREELNTALNTKGLAYIQKQVKAIDPVYYKSVDLQNSRRLIRALEVHATTGKTISSYQNKPKKPRDFDCIWVGLTLPRETLYKRINQRVENMIEEGLKEEVDALKPYQSLNPLRTVGYQEFYGSKINHTPVPFDQAIELIKRNSRRYAKRQLTWFRRNKDVKWFAPQEYKQVMQYVKES